MSLHLILGGSGAGKSYALYHKIIKLAMEERNTQFLILVPEQFTMETQKNVVEMHPDHGIVNIDILSFMRLAYGIFEETGNGGRSILEDTGKMMLLRKVLEQKKDQLQVFGTSVRKPGFLDELKSLLSEMLQYSVGEAELEKMTRAASDKPLLRGKLMDVMVVYEGFRELLREKYITSEEILELLCDVIDQSDSLKNSVICLDGYTGFTPSQYKLLFKLLKTAKQVYVTVTLDQREDFSREGEEFRLFHLSKKTILKLYWLAGQSHTDIEEPEWVGGESDTPRRFQDSEALASLEYNLFRDTSKPFAGKQEDIGIYAVHDPKEEVRFTIREIIRLVKDEQYRYRDIAVVTGDMAGYGDLIEKEYRSAGIPVFLDSKKDILSNPLVELLRSLMQLIEDNFNYTSVFRYLRCGLTGMDNEVADRLENYVLAMGIRGYSQWNRPFTAVFHKNKENELAELNEYRLLFLERISVFREQACGGKKSVLAYTRSLYDYIENQHIYEKLLTYQNAFEEEGFSLLAKEYKQIYGIIMDLFDRLVELLGEDLVTVREYGELLDAGFMEAKVGLIPPGVDQVMAGDIERTRLKDIRALFFIGVNDGIIPKNSGGGGILTDMERELLKENEIELAPTGRQKSYTEQFYLYLNLTKPKNRLYLTYARVGTGGKALNPSYLIRTVKDLFPELRVMDEDMERRDPDYYLGADQGMTNLLKGLRVYAGGGAAAEWKDLYGIYYKREDFRNQLKWLIDGVFYRNDQRALSRAAAVQLYGSELFNSVTRLERYAQCAFAHFMDFGLKLEPRKEFKINIPDMGSLFHNAIEAFSFAMKERKLSWREIGDEQRDLLAEEAVRSAVERFGSTVLQSSSRNAYIINRIERMTKRTLWALCSQLKEGSFEPAGYEIRFSPYDNLTSMVHTLKDGDNMRLQGRIDRLDTVEDDANVYIKVIDYKSGNTAFDLNQIYYGLSMQLIVYLTAAEEIVQNSSQGKKIIPAGVFYYRIDDPVIERPEGDYSEETIRKTILEQLKMSGLSNADKKVLALIDRAFEKEASVKSSIIPVELTAKGEFGAYSQVAAGEDFKVLAQFVRGQILKEGTEIMEGRIEAAPYRFGDKTGCDYCEYAGICGFDQKLPGSEYRNLAKLDRREIWEKIKGEEEQRRNGGNKVDTGTEEGN